MGRRNRRSVDIVRNASDHDLVEAQEHCQEWFKKGCTPCPIKGGKCILLEPEIVERFKKIIKEKENENGKNN